MVCHMQMVHEDDELYSVTEMASLLYGHDSPSSCYASHRLLSQERIFFKQAGRSPPRFQARSPKEVHSLQARRIADEKVGSHHEHGTPLCCCASCLSCIVKFLCDYALSWSGSVLLCILAVAVHHVQLCC